MEKTEITGLKKLVTRLVRVVTGIFLFVLRGRSETSKGEE